MFYKKQRETYFFCEKQKTTILWRTKFSRVFLFARKKWKCSGCCLLLWALKLSRKPAKFCMSVGAVLPDIVMRELNLSILFLLFFVVLLPQPTSACRVAEVLPDRVWSECNLFWPFYFSFFVLLFWALNYRVSQQSSACRVGPVLPDRMRGKRNGLFGTFLLLCVLKLSPTSAKFLHVARVATWNVS